jgi:hypothetical protein
LLLVPLHSVTVMQHRSDVHTVAVEASSSYSTAAGHLRRASEIRTATTPGVAWAGRTASLVPDDQNGFRSSWSGGNVDGRGRNLASWTDHSLRGSPLGGGGGGIVVVAVVGWWGNSCWLRRRVLRSSSSSSSSSPSSTR